MFEEEKSIIYSNKFIGNFVLSKEDFISNKRWTEVIKNTLKKISQFWILSEWKIVSNYLENEIKKIIKSLLVKINQTQDVELSQFLFTNQVNVTYKIDYEWYKFLNDIEDIIIERNFDKFEGLYVAHTLVNKDTINYLSNEKISWYTNLKQFNLFEKIIDNHEYAIDIKTSSSIVLEYIIALYSIWESIIVSIDDLWDVVFYKKENFIEELNTWKIWYCLDRIFENLMVDALRDDLELIEKYFIKKQLIYSNRNEVIVNDIEMCIDSVPNWRFSIDVHNWYAQSMSYDFKSIDCSNEKLHDIQDFVFGQWSIWFEYHQWKKNSIIGTKKFNYKKQIRNEKIANWQ